MPIFQIKNSDLISIKEIAVSLEKDIQGVTENNLGTVFGFDFISSEFSLHNLRIDTLAFDNETKSFVIIEYKKDRSFSIIDQGYAYLALMLNNKADFILEYNEKTKSNLKRDDIDWSQSRVLFLANFFTSYQQNAINFRDLPIELWEVKKYDNKTILYNQLKSPETNESIKTISKNKMINKVSQEVKVYTINDHFKKEWTRSRELFEKLSGRVRMGGGVEEKVLKHYIAYEFNGKNFVEIIVQASGLKIYLDINKESLKDSKNIVEDCSLVGHWATGNTRFKIDDLDDVDYAFFLIKQVYMKLDK